MIYQTAFYTFNDCGGILAETRRSYAHQRSICSHKQNLRDWYKELSDWKERVKCHHQWFQKFEIIV